MHGTTRRWFSPLERAWRKCSRTQRFGALAILAGVVFLAPLLIWWVNRPDHSIARVPNWRDVAAKARDVSSTPASAGGDAGQRVSGLDAIETVAFQETQPFLYLYSDSGFKEYTFGSSQGDVERLAGALVPAPRIPGWLQDTNQNNYKFDESGELRAMIRRYVGDNEGHLLAFRELLGRTNDDRIGTSTRRDPIYPSHAIATMEFEYIFPQTYVVIEANEEQLGYSKKERVLVSLYDREWLYALLVEHGRCLDEMLRWADSHVTPYAQGDGASLEHLVGPPGTRGEFKALGKSARYKSAPNGAFSETISFTNEHGQVLVVERILKDLPRGDRYQKVGAVRAYIPLGPLVAGRVPTLDRATNAIIVRVFSGVAQGVFVPEGESLIWRKKPESVTKSYEWDTSSNWHVIVSVDGILLLGAPRREL